MIKFQEFKYGFLHIGVCRLPSGDDTACYFDNELEFPLYSMVDIVVLSLTRKRLVKRFLKKLYKIRPDLKEETQNE